MEKILFFDFDGTLINTVGPVTQLFKDTADHWSDHIVTKDDVISTFGVNERGTLKQLTGDNGEKAFLEFFEAYKLMLNSVKPYPGIVDLLETLRDDGFTLILVTGNSAKTIYLQEYLPLRVFLLPARREETPGYSAMIKTSSMAASTRLAAPLSATSIRMYTV